ncbi:ATP-binding protein [bacterium]|nr:ATP-binding protein [bacterium]
MALFGKKKNDVENITKKNITIPFNSFSTKMTVRIKGAQSGTVDGKEILLDDQIINTLFERIASDFDHNNSKYFPQPEYVYIELNPDVPLDNNNLATQRSEDDISNSTQNDQQKDLELFTPIMPQIGLDDVYLERGTREDLDNTLAILKYRKKLFDEWKLGNGNEGSRAIVLNFWGPSGTGKTMTAEAIGTYINQKVLQVNYAQLESKYVGETPKNISKIFKIATEQNAILVFDEADSFLGKRLTSITQSADYGVNITRSVMLMELERFKGVVIFTTNLIKNYDEAFKRRILASIEFKTPDETGRTILWTKYLRKNIPLSPTISPSNLAKKYVGLTGADIKDIVLVAAINALRENGEYAVLSDEHFDRAAKLIKARYTKDNSFTTVKTERITQEQYEKEVGES